VTFQAFTAGLTDAALAAIGAREVAPA